MLAPARSSFPEATFTEEAFLWAVAAVRSRVHAPLEGDQIALVPLADLVRIRPCPHDLRSFATLTGLYNATLEDD